MRILIIDDEKIIREGIAHIIDEMELFQHVDMAKNGEEALILCEDHYYNILLLDIMMPKMNGIEFLERLEQLEKNHVAKTQIPLQPIKVVISGYDEFEYAQKCLALGVEEFILKPIEPDEIVELVERLYEKALVVQDNKNRHLEQKEQVRASIPILREKFFWDLVDQNLTEREIVQKSEFIGINLDAQEYVATVTATVDSSGSEMIKKLALIAFRKAIEADPPKDIRMLCFEIGISKMATIFCFDDRSAAEEEVESYLARIIEELHSKEGFTINTGVGRSMKKVEDIRKSYHQAHQALQYAFLLSEAGVQKIKDEEAHVVQGLSVEDMVTLSSAIKLNQKPEAEDFLNRAFAELHISVGENAVPYSKVLLTGIIFTCLSILHQKSIHMVSEKYVDYYKTILDDNALHSAQQLKELSRKLVEETLGQIETHDLEKKSIFSQKAKEMVQKYYAESLTTLWIAEELGLSRNYFGQLFKKDVGMTFNEYLNDKRITVAKQLLENPSLKIYEVGQSVGIDDSFYFSNIFKKLVGCSPREYRELL